MRDSGKAALRGAGWWLTYSSFPVRLDDGLILGQRPLTRGCRAPCSRRSRILLLCCPSILSIDQNVPYRCCRLLQDRAGDKSQSRSCLVPESAPSPDQGHSEHCGRGHHGHSHSLPILGENLHRLDAARRDPEVRPRSRSIRRRFTVGLVSNWLRLLSADALLPRPKADPSAVK